ncbi:MAG: hypothetical protein CMJ78_08630 [Planctomycetaceae bacterium]|nr:hypothetical protein [Planctomycetaceae bacterium]
MDRLTAILKLRLWILLALVGYWLALFIATHLPEPESLMPKKVSDKWLHFGAYFGLAVLLSSFCSVKTNTSLKTRAYLPAIALLLYGIADELLQIPVNRTCDVMDWLADSAGVVVGVAVTQVARKTSLSWLQGKRT